MPTKGCAKPLVVMKKCKTIYFILLQNGSKEKEIF